jgi:hypothetical protein
LAAVWQCWVSPQLQQWLATMARLLSRPQQHLHHLLQQQHPQLMLQLHLPRALLLLRATAHLPKLPTASFRA